MKVKSDNEINIHRTHCCVIHGCKYAESDCPVVNKQVVQAYPCMDCGYEKITIEKIKEIAGN